MSVNIRPLPGYVVLKKHETEQKIGSLEIPDDAKERPCVGEVIAVGQETHATQYEDRKLLELIYETHPGDTATDIIQSATLSLVSLYLEPGALVAYERYGAHELKYGEDEFVLVPFEKLMGVIEGE